MPEIPSSGPAGNLVALGQGMMDLGGAIAGIRQPQAPKVDMSIAKAYLDAEIFSEITQATNYANQESQNYVNSLSQNPNAENYWPGWLEAQQKIEEAVTPILKRPEALQAFHERFWTDKKAAVGKVVSDSGTSLRIAQTEGLATDTVNNAISAGDVKTIKDTVALALAKGVYSSNTAKTILADAVPKAEYANALNMMSTWDRKSQLDLLNAGNAEKILGLDTAQVQNLREALDKKYASQVSYAAEQKVKTQADIGSKLLGLITADPTKDVDFKVVADAYSQLIGSPYESIAKNELDRQNSKREDINKANIEEGMSVNYTNYSGQLLNWKWNFGTGDAPISLDDLVSARNSPDPASKITVTEYDKLVTLFDSIVAFKNSAEGKTDQVAANELWDYAIGDHPGWSAEDRARAMAATGYMGTKVDGDTYNTILNAANSDISRHEDWDSYLKQVTASFDAQLSALAADQKTGAVLQDLAYKRGIAYRTMLNVLRTYTDGDKTGLWQQKVDEFKTKNIVDTANSSVAAALTSPSGVRPVVARSLENIARAVLGWAFPRATAGLGASPEMQLEWARQQNPEKFALEPDAYSTWKNELPRIREQLRNLLSLKTSRVIAKNATIATGTRDDTVFVNGNTYYQFRSEVVGNDVRNVLYENTVDDKGNWSGWEAK